MEEAGQEGTAQQQETMQVEEETGEGAAAAEGENEAQFQVPDSMMSQMMDAWGRKPEYYCDVCQIDCKSADCYRKHLGGAKHKKKEAGTSKFVSGDEDLTTGVEMNLSLAGEPMIGLECIQVSGEEQWNKLNWSRISPVSGYTYG